MVDYQQPQYNQPPPQQPYAQPPQQQQQYYAQQPPAQQVPQQFQQFPQAAAYQHPPQQVPFSQAPQVYNTRGYGTMQNDYSISGIIGVDVAWLQSLIARYQAGDMEVIDTDRQGMPTGKLKLSMSAKYNPNATGRSTHKLSLYVRSDLPPRAY